ncbi:MAG TPA: L,D-transpeptidase family protein [Allosphingosinicella sp.]
MLGFRSRNGRTSIKAGLALAAGALTLLASPAPVPAQHAPTMKAAVAQAQAQAQAQAPRAVPAAVTAPARPRQMTLSDVVVRRELPINQWLRPGEFAWNDDGVPAGPTTIVVNLRGRVLSAYRDGIEVGRSSILYGTDGKPTPTGTFTIMEKKARHFSNIYKGAPMPHMMRLTNDGIAIHGSPELADDVATHGCIGLPPEFAELLFGSARVGDKVLIWKGDRVG